MKSWMSNLIEALLRGLALIGAGAKSTLEDDKETGKVHIDQQWTRGSEKSRRLELNWSALSSIYILGGNRERERENTAETE